MPMTLSQAYELLEVTETSSPDEIKRAYRRLALKTHPDKNPNDPNAHKTFQRISEAYKRITEPDSFRDEDHGDGEFGGHEMSEEEMSAMFTEIFADIIGGSGTFHLSPQMFVMMEMMMGGDYDEEDDDDDDGGGGNHRQYHEYYEDDDDGDEAFEAAAAAHMFGMGMNMDRQMMAAMAHDLAADNEMFANDNEDEDGYFDHGFDDLSIMEHLLMGGNGKRLSTREKREMEEIMAHLGLGGGSNLKKSSSKSKKPSLRQSKSKSNSNSKSKLESSKSTSGGSGTKKRSPLRSFGSKSVGNVEETLACDESKTKTASSASSSSAKNQPTRPATVAAEDRNNKDTNDADWETDSSEDSGRVRTMKRNPGQMLPVFPFGIPYDEPPRKTSQSSKSNSKLNPSSSATSSAETANPKKKKVATETAYLSSSSAPTSTKSVSSSTPNNQFSEPESIANNSGSSKKTNEKKNIQIGYRVLVQNRYPGAVAYVGEVHYARGTFVGVITDDPSVGKNNGIIKGTQYFKCPSGKKALMVPLMEATLI